MRIFPSYLDKSFVQGITIGGHRYLMWKQFCMLQSCLSIHIQFYVLVSSLSVSFCSFNSQLTIIQRIDQWTLYRSTSSRRFTADYAIIPSKPYNSTLYRRSNELLSSILLNKIFNLIQQKKNHLNLDFGHWFEWSLFRIASSSPKCERRMV